MKNSWLIFIFSLFFVACEQPLTELKEGSYPNGQVKSIKYFAGEGEDKKLVKEEQFHENGKLKMEGAYQDGERHGIWKAYFKSGQLQSEGAFKHGKREGQGNVYWPNGNLRYEGQYSNDKKSGHWKFYNEEGKIVEEKDF